MDGGQRPLSWVPLPVWEPICDVSSDTKDQYCRYALNFCVTLLPCLLLPRNAHKIISEINQTLLNFMEFMDNVGLGFPKVINNETSFPCPIFTDFLQH